MCGSMGYDSITPTGQSVDARSGIAPNRVRMSLCGMPVTVGRVNPASTSFRGITLRAVLFGLPLMLVNAYWITLLEVRWYTLDGTSLPLFITPVFFLFCLTIGNLAVRRVRPRIALSQAE